MPLPTTSCSSEEKFNSFTKGAVEFSYRGHCTERSTLKMNLNLAWRLETDRYHSEELLLDLGDREWRQHHSRYRVGDWLDAPECHFSKCHPPIHPSTHPSETLAYFHCSLLPPQLCNLARLCSPFRLKTASGSEERQLESREILGGTQLPLQRSRQRVIGRPVQGSQAGSCCRAEPA